MPLSSRIQTPTFPEQNIQPIFFPFFFPVIYLLCLVAIVYMVSLVRKPGCSGGRSRSPQGARATASAAAGWVAWRSTCSRTGCSRAGGCRSLACWWRGWSCGWRRCRWWRVARGFEAVTKVRCANNTCVIQSMCPCKTL